MTRGALVTGAGGLATPVLAGALTPGPACSPLVGGRLCAYSLWYPSTGGEQSWAGLVLLDGGRLCATAFGTSLSDASNP